MNNFAQTRKMLPYFIYGVGTTLIIYFLAMSHFNADTLCEKGVHFQTCSEKVPQARSFLTLMVIVMLGPAFAGLIGIFISDLKKQKQNDRKSAI